MAEIKLADRVAVITGASRGLGRSIATALAQAGARVVLASPETELLRDVAGQIENQSGKGRALPVTTDITKLSDCKNLLEQVMAKFGATHMLLNCARRMVRGEGHSAAERFLPFWKLDPELWLSSFDVNVNGAFLLSQVLAAQMLNHGWGRIVNVTTSIDTMQLRANSPYGVTKAALEASTMIWAQDLHGTGVTVNSILPGGKCNTDPTLDPEEAKKLLPVTILNPLALWLASDLSNGRTGGRYVGKLWRSDVSPEQAAEDALEPPVLRTIG